MLSVLGRTFSKNDAWTEADKFVLTFALTFFPLEIAFVMVVMRASGPRWALGAIGTFALLGHAVWTGLPRLAPPAPAARGDESDDLVELVPESAPGAPYRRADPPHTSERDDVDVQREPGPSPSLLYMRVVLWAIIVLSAVAFAVGVVVVAGAAVLFGKALGEIDIGRLVR